MGWKSIRTGLTSAAAGGGGAEGGGGGGFGGAGGGQELQETLKKLTETEEEMTKLQDKVGWLCVTHPSFVRTQVVTCPACRSPRSPPPGYTP